MADDLSDERLADMKRVVEAHPLKRLRVSPSIALRLVDELLRRRAEAVPIADADLRIRERTAALPDVGACQAELERFAAEIAKGRAEAKARRAKYRVAKICSDPALDLWQVGVQIHTKQGWLWLQVETVPGCAAAYAVAFKGAADLGLAPPEGT